ncbi:MAG: hypothetical protein JNM51_09250, partial [Bacteroidia bacterium]|nr:hypothetical protein [Bacteroidia bacterium]
MKKKPAASGERNAIGGYLPQFDTFAWLTYQELIRGNFVWLRIADYKAEKLDDVQYSTKTEVHAYQIKWSNQDTPEPFSFNDFKRILPDILTSWKTLKTLHAGENKEIIAHLLTNRPLSKNDSIKNPSKVKIGTFADFYIKVWLNLKTGQKIETKWKFAEAALRKLLNLNNVKFQEFLDHFEFQPGYSKPISDSTFLDTEKQREDLKQFSRFIMDEVASKEKQIHFELTELIKRLGVSWQLRFKTTFNHELIVDKRKYQPITQTLSELDDKISKLQNGYIFILGGPGAGKSTLITEWSKNRSERIIKYYAFDFTNPSSAENHYERGESVSLYFDLVFQIKEAGFYKENVLPYKDIVYLKKTFSTQIEQLGVEYANSGRKTIIIIDGLDHIPREYKTTIHSFLADLPTPNSIPNGVYLLLGSQSYELENISQEIKLESQNNDRNIIISPLGKKEVYNYIEANTISSITNTQKERLYEKSQGHPLYLSYIIERVKNTGKINELLNSIEKIDGNIELYYRKIWQPISSNAALIELLGLISRINGETNPKFVSEWFFDRQVLIEFRKNAKLLFEQSEEGWSFFHNSFKQFLITESAINPLTGLFDSNYDQGFHEKLTSFYETSKVEPSWNKFYHIYKSGNLDQFTKEATPEEFVKQVLDYRPTQEIRRDIQSGIEIAKTKKDVNILVRYLFALTELDNRSSNLDPATLTKYFLSLNKGKTAKNYLRSGKALLCSSKFAFKMSRIFYRFNDKKEANFLFNLAIPNYIHNTEIVVNEDHRYEEIKETCEEWIRTAPYFMSFNEIMEYVENIHFMLDHSKNLPFDESEEDFKLSLINCLAYSLIKLRDWNSFEGLLNEFDPKSKKSLNCLFEILNEAINVCIDTNDIEKANWLLSLLIKKFPKDKIRDTGRVFVADLIYKVTGNLKAVQSWIAKPELIVIPDEWNIGYDGSLRSFYPFIKLNKLRNLCGKGLAISKALPVPKNQNEIILVEYLRALFLTVKILSDGLTKTTEKDNFLKKIQPIVRFFYKNYTMRERYWYQIKQTKGEYYDFLIYSTSAAGGDFMIQTGDFLLNEFVTYPEYWPCETQRKVLDSLLNYGYNKDIIKTRLKVLETNMLIGNDVSGRIDECLAQLKLSLKLSEAKYAEKMIKQSIQESIGVGYRKDYQFNSWIEWIEQTNEIDKEKAGDRIKWILSHLGHIEQTTEGRAYWDASDGILKAAFKWDFSAGTQQLRWQIDNEHIGFEDAITIFTEFYLSGCQNQEEFHEIYHFYIECLIVFSEHPSSNLLSSLLEKGWLLTKDEFQTSFLSQIITAIMTRAVEETRFHLLKQVQNFCEMKNIPLEHIYPDFILPQNPDENEVNSGANELTIENNPERLKENDVLSRIGNFNDLKELVEHEGPHSHFDWSKSIEKIANILTEDQISNLAELTKSKSRESRFLISLSQTAFKNGFINLAKELAENAIQLSNSYGWNKFYDGGTRLNAFLNLKEIAPKEATEKAFEVFAFDAINGGYSYSLSLDLENILPALTETLNVKEIWIEISGYLDRLLANSIPDSNVPTLNPGERSFKENYIDLLFYFF